MKFEQYGAKATRFGFGEGLVTLGERDERIVVLGGDITGSVLTSFFQQKFPDRFFSAASFRHFLFQKHTTKLGFPQYG